MNINHFGGLTPSDFDALTRIFSRSPGPQPAPHTGTSSPCALCVSICPVTPVLFPFSIVHSPPCALSLPWRRLGDSRRRSRTPGAKAFFGTLAGGEHPLGLLMPFSSLAAVRNRAPKP
jgi:hypothetical protein